MWIGTFFKGSNSIWVTNNVFVILQMKVSNLMVLRLLKQKAEFGRFSAFFKSLRELREA